MNPLLLPEYLMEKAKKLSERISGTHGGQLLNILIATGLIIALGVFLSGALYVGIYFKSVPWMIDLTSYNYGVYFYMPRVLGDPLTQTTLEMVYVLISYVFAGIGTFLLAKGSKPVSQRNTGVIFGIVLIAISLLMIFGLDYLKTSSIR